MRNVLSETFLDRKVLLSLWHSEMLRKIIFSVLITAIKNKMMKFITGKTINLMAIFWIIDKLNNNYKIKSIPRKKTWKIYLKKC